MGHGCPSIQVWCDVWILSDSEKLLKLLNLAKNRLQEQIFCHEIRFKPLIVTQCTWDIWNGLSLKFSKHICFSMWILAVFKIIDGLRPKNGSDFAEKLLKFDRFFLLFWTFLGQNSKFSL